MATVVKQETITYSTPTWDLEVTETESGGINYELIPKATLNFNTNQLVHLEQIINKAVTNAHADRAKLLS